MAAQTPQEQVLQIWKQWHDRSLEVAWQDYSGAADDADRCTYSLEVREGTIDEGRSSSEVAPKPGLRDIAAELQRHADVLLVVFNDTLRADLCVHVVCRSACAPLRPELVGTAS